MHDLEKALTDIRAVRTQIARSTEFRGYGPAAFAATSALAAMAACGQALALADPAADVTSYLILWTVTALMAAAIIGVDVVTRSRRVHSRLADEMVWSAAEQLLPAGVAGALLTFVLYRFAPESLWMLPGLWQIVLSLGAFAACRLLPAPMMAVPVWYLACGLACLALAGGEAAFSPWAMGLPFGVGQLLAAGLIFYVRGGDVED